VSDDSRLMSLPPFPPDYRASGLLLHVTSLPSQTHPGAAASLREGLDETLTLQRLGVTGALYRTLRGTNAIENLNGLVGHFVRHVRWIAAGLQEARRSFRRVRGHADLAALIRALDRYTLDTRKEVA
jgi:putative transposase